MEEKNIEVLWKKYEKSRTQEIKQALIEHYVYLVKLVAGRLSIYLNHYVDLDDLLSYGVIGLIDALDKFDSAKNVKFETYASLRIRGAILDEIRKLDWVPRSLRKKQKDLNKVYFELENKLGRTPTDDEIANTLQMTKEDYYGLLQDTNIANLVFIEDYELQASSVKDEKNDMPDEYMEKQEIMLKLKEALDELPEREKRVITFYYFEELTLKEISNILEVSESRVSQLHTKGVSRLKVKLAKYHLALPL
ncbi:FliA/WhiG family RNA polymerase sigma factor [Niameybacter massiliensis]|uniref:RNA polymerase sigma factor n=1 Tax=Holtiella tumoricola TaxID=3018743 RepID=A0AA42DPZ1_9FIRM|nr:FliA/WhiG family RNA polymerase sigma factor [Niameybacter massiliensis]MDA3732613.1 FliA/WhiG family RNA polymerase sigma factor [Holtiella tumoricola]